MTKIDFIELSRMADQHAKAADGLSRAIGEVHSELSDAFSTLKRLENLAMEMSGVYAIKSHCGLQDQRAKALPARAEVLATDKAITALVTTLPGLYRKFEALIPKAAELTVSRLEIMTEIPAVKAMYAGDYSKQQFLCQMAFGVDRLSVATQIADCENLIKALRNETWKPLIGKNFRDKEIISDYTCPRCRRINLPMTGLQKGYLALKCPLCHTVSWRQSKCETFAGLRTTTLFE